MELPCDQKIKYPSPEPQVRPVGEHLSELSHENTTSLPCIQRLGARDRSSHE